MKYRARKHDVIDASVGEHLDLVVVVLLGLLGRHPVAVPDDVPVAPEGPGTIPGIFFWIFFSLVKYSVVRIGR